MGGQKVAHCNSPQYAYRHPASTLKTLLKLLLNSNYVTISKLTNTLKSMDIAVGKSTVSDLLSYIENSYFMNELLIYNQGVVNQLQYPRKIYFIDTGFMTALSTKFSRNMGRLLENAVFHKLVKESGALYYCKDSNENEVDFAVLNGGKTTALYQVCFDLTEAETQKREARSLVKAGTALGCKDLYLLTLERNNKVKLPEEIRVIPMAEFL
ncbi:TPA: hypothetical protein DCY43_00410 [candidate division WWE3 bacterium]|uniref:DUF4143 domain-containing protein n=2 Tax=Bacteria candidate phyla TaxID=1783234 RepID=A0A0G0ZF58_9BACT|nr:MAG: hypothetical protein UU78_C0056G0005 [Candidatus Roizmanbacteria bacterium GW2011_GWC2_41_7]HAZ29204.1 hypothetical protein [candidate division WWE3 bacterium]